MEWGHLAKYLPEPIIDFLTEYETHAQARKANSKLLADFVTRMNRVDELTQWTVAVIGGIDRHHDVCGFSVPLMMRKASEGSLTVIPLAVYFPTR